MNGNKMFKWCFVWRVLLRSGSQTKLIKDTLVASYVGCMATADRQKILAAIWIIWLHEILGTFSKTQNNSVVVVIVVVAKW